MQAEQFKRLRRYGSGMVDVAVVSVVSSALVAGGTILVNFIGGERQRQHETDLSFEARVWERKSEALLAVIQECQKIIDAPTFTADRKERTALSLSKALDVFEAQVGTVGVFGSREAGEALWELIYYLRDSGVLAEAGQAVDYYKARWQGAKTDDYADPAEVGSPTPEAYRNWEKLLVRKAGEDLDIDQQLLIRRARILREAARESIRRPKD